MSSAGFVQLEELDERLRGKRIHTYLPHAAKDAFRYIRLMVSNVQSGGEPFPRLICVTGTSLSRAQADGLAATMIISPRDNTDWSLILTAVAAHLSALVVVFPDCKAPDAFVARLPPTATLIQFRPLEEPWTSRGYGLYFFPHVADMAAAEADLIVKRITEIGSTQLPDLRSVLKELRMAGAGLVISGAGALHWWDAREEMPALRRRPDVNAALLHFLADTVG
jgi:hypothetical protein